MHALGRSVCPLGRHAPGTARAGAGRRSAPGWKAATSTFRSRATTGWPSSSASTSTSGPARSIHGARMKTARSGSSPSPSTARPPRSCGPAARTRCAAPRCPSARGGCGRARSARRRCRAPARPLAGELRERLLEARRPRCPIWIVVLSPPGITSPSSSSSCSGRRTSTASAPSRSSAARVRLEVALDRQHADPQRPTPAAVRRRCASAPTSHDAGAGSARRAR